MAWVSGVVVSLCVSSVFYAAVIASVADVVPGVGVVRYVFSPFAPLMRVVYTGPGAAGVVESRVFLYLWAPNGSIVFAGSSRGLGPGVVVDSSVYGVVRRVLAGWDGVVGGDAGVGLIVLLLLRGADSRVSLVVAVAPIVPRLVLAGFTPQLYISQRPIVLGVLDEGLAVFQLSLRRAVYAGGVCVPLAAVWLQGVGGRVHHVFLHARLRAEGGEVVLGSMAAVRGRDWARYVFAGLSWAAYSLVSGRYEHEVRFWGPFDNHSVAVLGFRGDVVWAVFVLGGSGDTWLVDVVLVRPAGGAWLDERLACHAIGDSAVMGAFRALLDSGWSGVWRVEAGGVMLTTPMLVEGGWGRVFAGVAGPAMLASMEPGAGLPPPGLLAVPVAVEAQGHAVPPDIVVAVDAPGPHVVFEWMLPSWSRGVEVRLPYPVVRGAEAPPSLPGCCEG